MISAPELVAAAMARSAVATHAELARELGLTAFGSPKRVSRWAAGENEPDYESTLRLLAVAGLLRGSAKATYDPRIPEDPLPIDPLAELEARVDRQERATATTLAVLAADVGAIRLLLEPPDTQATDEPRL